VLNEGSTNTIKSGQATQGIYDVDSEGELPLSVVAVTRIGRVDCVTDTFDIPGDGLHVRGTYPRNERRMAVNFEGSEPAWVVADGSYNCFLQGKAHPYP